MCKNYREFTRRLNDGFIDAELLVPEHDQSYVRDFLGRIEDVYIRLRQRQWLPSEVIEFAWRELTYSQYEVTSDLLRELEDLAIHVYTARQGGYVDHKNL